MVTAILRCNFCAAKPRVSLRKGVRVPIGVPGEGCAVGFGWVVGDDFPVEKEGKWDLGSLSLRAQRLEKFKIPSSLKFSSAIENFKRAAAKPLLFCGEFRRSRLKFWSEIENFKRDWFFSIFGPLGLGWGLGKGTGKSTRTHLSKLSFSKLPFSFSSQRAENRGG